MGNKRKPYVGTKHFKKWKKVARNLKKIRLLKPNKGETPKTLKQETSAPSVENNDVSELDGLAVYISCVSCGSPNTPSDTLKVLDDEAILSVFRSWFEPEPVDITKHASCQACWDLAQEVLSGRQTLDQTKKLVHSNLCLHCGQSLKSVQLTDQLNTGSRCESKINEAVQEWITPRTVQETSRICDLCWQRASKSISREEIYEPPKPLVACYIETTEPRTSYEGDLSAQMQPPEVKAEPTASYEGDLSPQMEPTEVKVEPITSYEGDLSPQMQSPEVKAEPSISCQENLSQLMQQLPLLVPRIQQIEGNAEPSTSYQEKLPPQMQQPPFLVPRIQLIEGNAEPSTSYQEKLPPQMQQPPFLVPRIQKIEGNAEPSTSYQEKLPPQMQQPPLLVPRIQLIKVDAEPSTSYQEKLPPKMQQSPPLGSRIKRIKLKAKPSTSYQEKSPPKMYQPPRLVPRIKRIEVKAKPSTSYQEKLPPQIQSLPRIDSIMEPESTIILPNYKRAENTNGKCVVEKCKNKSNHNIPHSMRKLLLDCYNYYIPDGNQICKRHYYLDKRDLLYCRRSDYERTFTAKHIEDMMKLCGGKMTHPENNSY